MYWKTVNAFLNTIAESAGYERDSLSLVVDLCSGGPTVQPDPTRNVVDMSVTVTEDSHMPSGGYDSIGSRHLEFRVVRLVGEEGKTQIPTTLYSFQHHPFPGCCKFAVNRWVRCFDETWTRELQLKALEFRKAFAKSCSPSYSCLFTSKGPSGSKSGELYEEFEMIFDSGHGQTMYGTRT